MTASADRVALPAECDVLLREETHDLRTAARLAGVRASYHAMIRAALAGALGSVRIGGRRLTSVRAVREWVARANAPRDLPPPARRRARRAAKTTEAERRVLRSRGLPA